MLQGLKRLKVIGPSAALLAGKAQSWILQGNNVFELGQPMVVFFVRRLDCGAGEVQMSTR